MLSFTQTGALREADRQPFPLVTIVDSLTKYKEAMMSLLNDIFVSPIGQPQYATVG